MFQEIDSEGLADIASCLLDILDMDCHITNMIIITHLAGQTYVWRGCKWNFAGPQIYLQPPEIKSQHFGVSLKFLVC